MGAGIGVVGMEAGKLEVCGGNPAVVDIVSCSCIICDVVWL